MGGVDLSWIAGLLITSPTYYWLAKRSVTFRDGPLAQNHQARA
jgi:hypothetical protein